ncbi:MAG: hypothetical protein OXE50_11900, partial [Chloroflexi bacterium]|nr:hypothetical protein [Chloroflexota bacterium]
MAVIDADTHVDECEETWQFIAPEDARFRPATVVPIEELDSGAAVPGTRPEAAVVVPPAAQPP